MHTMSGCALSFLLLALFFCCGGVLFCFVFVLIFLVLPDRVSLCQLWLSGNPIDQAGVLPAPECWDLRRALPTAWLVLFFFFNRYSLVILRRK